MAFQSQAGIDISLVYIFKKTMDNGRQEVRCPHFWFSQNGKNSNYVAILARIFTLFSP